MSGRFADSPNPGRRPVPRNESALSKVTLAFPLSLDALLANWSRLPVVRLFTVALSRKREPPCLFVWMGCANLNSEEDNGRDRTPLKSVMTLEPFIGGACSVDIKDRRHSGVLMIEYDSERQRLNLPWRSHEEARVAVS